MTRRLLIIAGSVAAVLALAMGGWAFFTSTGSGTASANVGTLTAPGQPTRTGTGSTVGLSWAASTASSGGTISYHVERSTDPVTTWSDACGTTAGSGTTSTSCTDTPSAGAYRYRVTAIFTTWTATGAVSDAFVVTGGDTTPPYVLSINRADASPTNAGTLNWTVTFSESVTGVDSTDFALARTGALSGGSVTGVSGTGTTRTVTASTGTGDGTLGLNLADNDSIVDGASNPLGTSGGAGDGSFTGQVYAVDKTAPSVSSINRKSGSTNPTNAASLDFAVTFSEPVSNVVAARFAVTTSNVTGTAPSVTAVTAVGSAPTDTWTVTVGTSGAIGANNGSVRLDLTSVGSVQDTSTNLLSGTHTGDQSFTFDTTAPAAPVSVSLANGGGSGNAFVNNANKSSVNIDVALDAGSSASDTVTLTVDDAGSAHSSTLTASATAGAGTVHFTGIDLSAFADGTITMSATSKDTLTNTSGSTSNTATKDVVAPNAPTTVALTNGGGAGSVFINNANKASVNYSVTLGSGSLSTDVVALSISDAGNAHTVTPSSVPGTSGAGSVSFNGNNLTALNDGTVTARATATDLAGNVSGTTSTTNAKDAVAPNAPTAVALTNGGGTGNAFINNANKASVNYSVTLGAGSVTTDTINLSIADAGNAHTVTPSSVPGTSGAGTVSFNANNVTTLNDGTVTATASASDQAGNSATSSTSNTKDVVAPNAPTTVALTNGGGTGNAFINNANKASINYSVTLAAGSLTTDSISLSIADAGSAHTVTPSNAAGTSGAGSVAFNANNLTTFNDGTVIATSTATDQAGNTSETTTGTNSKDGVAPTNALTLTAQGNASLTGTTLYYSGTGANRTFKIQNAVSDSGSGPASSVFATLGGTSTGFTFTGSTVTTPAGGPYVSNAVTWTSGTTTSPTETVTGSDAAGNTAQTTLTFTNDITNPTNTLSLATSPAPLGAFLNGTTLFYKSNAAGSFTLVNTVSDAFSGVASSTFPAISATGWTHNLETVTTPPGGPFTSSLWSWTATPSAPGTRNVTSLDNVGNTGTTTVTFTADATAPTGGAVSVNGTAASAGGSTSTTTNTSFTIDSRTNYTDAGSGLDSSTLTIQSETFNGTTCGAPGSGGPFTSPTTVSGTSQPGGIQAGFCYLYTLAGTDNVGNTTSISTTVTVGLNYTFAVTNATARTAGSAFSTGVTVQLQLNGSNTNQYYGSAYSGTKTIAFSGPGTSPSGAAPTYPATLSFSGSGVATAGTITLTKAETTTLTATDSAPAIDITGTSASFAVNAGTAARLAWTSVTVDAGTLSSPCLFTCTDTGLGNQKDFVARVSVTDNLGNTVSNLGTGHTVAVTTPTSGTGSGGAFTAPTSGTSVTLTISNTGFADSTATFTFHTQNGTWTQDTFSTQTLAGTVYTSASATVTKS